MSLPWFRFYHEFAGDPIVQCLAFEDQRHFVMVLCLKAAGFLDRAFPTPEFRNRMVCHALGLDPVAGSEALRRLGEVGLLGPDWQPTNWEKRQFTSDDASERVRNWRAKKRETLLKRNRNVQVTPQDTDTDTDTDTEKKVGTRARRASTIPRDFGMTETRKAYAEKKLPNGDVMELLESFLDNHRAKASTFNDWDAAWRTWVRNGLKYGYPIAKGQNGKAARQEPTPEALSAAQREAAEANRRNLRKALGDVADRLAS